MRGCLLFIHLDSKISHGGIALSQNEYCAASKKQSVALKVLQFLLFIDLEKGAAFHTLRKTIQFSSVIFYPQKVPDQIENFTFNRVKTL